MGEGSRISWLILASVVLVIGACIVNPGTFLQKSPHSVVVASPVPLMHVKKERFPGATSATVAHVPEIGKDSDLGRLPSAGGGSYQDKVVIVTFHDISPKVYSPYVITPDQFTADIAMIHQNFHVITNTEFIGFLNHKGSVPSNAVLITFDDGYQDMYKYAVPILTAHHMSGTFFDIVRTADVNNGTFLTWNEMQQMVHDGMCVESHTYASHYEIAVRKRKVRVPVFDTRMTIDGKRETILAYHRRVFADFSRARLELESHLGEPVYQIAWPYGYGSPFAGYIANEAGYRYLYTTNDGYVTASTNRGRIPRIDIGKSYISASDAEKMIFDIVIGRNHKQKRISHL